MPIYFSTINVLNNLLKEILFENLRILCYD